MTRFSPLLISIFESEVSYQFMNAHRLSNTLTELSLKNTLSNIGYDHSQVVKFHIDLINQTFLYPIILSTHAGFESLLQQLCKWIETGFDFKDSLDPFDTYTLTDMGNFLRGKDYRSKWDTNLFDKELEKS